MANEISGKIFTILPAQTGQGQNGNWVKQSFVIETSTDRYPKKICFVAWNDKSEMISRMKEGDEVKVSFDLESREYNGRWYTDAKAWKIEAGGNAVAPPSSRPSFTSPANDLPPPPADDLPF
jgi:hypothetical protein